MFGRIFEGIKGAFQVEIDNGIHASAGEILDTALIVGTAGVDHQYIEFTHQLFGILQALCHFSFNRRIAAQKAGTDIGRHLLTFSATASDDHLRATGDKICGNCEADARGSTGNQCCLSFKRMHNSFLLCSVYCCVHK